MFKIVDRNGHEYTVYNVQQGKEDDDNIEITFLIYNPWDNEWQIVDPKEFEPVGGG